MLDQLSCFKSAFETVVLRRLIIIYRKSAQTSFDFFCDGFTDISHIILIKVSLVNAGRWFSFKRCHFPIFVTTWYDQCMFTVSFLTVET